MDQSDKTPAPFAGRRLFLAGVAGFGAAAAAWSRGVAAAPRSYRIAFANANEAPGVRLEGLGFTGLDVRRGFELAARTLPVEMLYFDNAGEAARALANAADAVRQKVDLLVEFNPEISANAEIARRLKTAGIPVLAVGYPVGEAPVYAADNRGAGTIAGRALGQFAKQTWPDQAVLAAIVGDLGDPSETLALRLQGVTAGLRQEFPSLIAIPLDTGGQPLRAEALLGKFLATQPRRKVLIAALDDPTALAAKTGIELAGRLNDCVIVSHGLDRSVHGGASEKKEIDPTNRGSVLLGSVAYFMDRYGYDVLPLALRLLDGQPVAARTSTQHILVTGRNVFQEYPPYDLN